MAAPLQTIRCNLILVFIIGSTFITYCSASHFRGGTISWKALGGKEFQFYFTLSWTYNNGPGCNSSTIGQFLEDAGGKPGKNTKASQFWECTTCGTLVPLQLSTVGYFCTGVSQSEDWEQGERIFNYTFPASEPGPFIVEFTGQDWMKLGNGKGDDDWRLRTTVDARDRSDIGRPNSSPVAQSQAFYKLQHDCHHELQIPTFDPDGDTVRCRWSKGKECESVCDALPFATLNETTCTITFDATRANTYKPGEFYGVAVTIEDYPASNITVGNQSMTTSNVLSSIPVQFLIQTPRYATPCDERPRMIDPTPAEGSTVYVQAGDTMVVQMVADNGNSLLSTIDAISVSAPSGIKQSSVMTYQSAPKAYYKSLTWDTTTNNVGTHLVCAYASNTIGKTSASRCFTIEVVTTLPPTVPTPTFAVAVPTPQACMFSQPLPFYRNQDVRDTIDYCDCVCVISTDEPSDDNALRYFIAAFIGFQIGLVLFLLAVWLYYYCRSRPPHKAIKKRKRSSPQTVVEIPPLPPPEEPCEAEPCEVPPKPGKKLTVHDRLARRMTCTRPWCEVHRHRHPRQSRVSLRKIMKIIRKK